MRQRAADRGARLRLRLQSVFTLPEQPRLDLKGFDISPNGIAAGREIAGHFALSDKISLDRIDLTDASDPNLAAIAGEAVFTYFCIEQIPYDVRKVVENIIAAKPKRVINIEPTTELLDLTHPRDLVSLVYIRSVDYQTQLFPTLDQLEREGRIRIVARERMPFAPTINNDGFLYCWEPYDHDAIPHLPRRLPRNRRSTSFAACSGT